MKRFQSILAASTLTLAISATAFAGDITGKAGDTTAQAIAGDITGRTKPGDITGKPGDITGKLGDITGLTASIIVALATMFR